MVLHSQISKDTCDIFTLPTNILSNFFLQALNWNLTPITINSWLNIYLQLSCLASKHGKTTNFHLPDYPQQQFVQVTEVGTLYFTNC